MSTRARLLLILSELFDLMATALVAWVEAIGELVTRGRRA